MTQEEYDKIIKYRKNIPTFENMFVPRLRIPKKCIVEWEDACFNALLKDCVSVIGVCSCCLFNFHTKENKKKFNKWLKKEDTTYIGY